MNDSQRPKPPNSAASHETTKEKAKRRARLSIDPSTELKAGGMFDDLVNFFRWGQ